jgi:hypothetical protein
MCHLLGPRVIPYVQQITDVFLTSGQILNFTSHTFVLESLHANDLSLAQLRESCRKREVYLSEPIVSSVPYIVKFVSIE